ncbi:MAG TPA: DUF4442 domain-containing protein [Chitinophagaceae bacterium]|jgi:hypothetical protein|nr:DUF4442 domain-containing protein [Chitinophagaceae bacterium]
MEKKFETAAGHDPAAFFILINHPLKFKWFLLNRLPAAFMAGLRMHHCSEQMCTVSVPFKKLTQNPFRSTYFACLAMAAEMTTGALVMAQIYKRRPSLSMLIVSMESKYHKKAIGLTRFTCSEGTLVKDIINEAYTSGTAQSIKLHSKGVNELDELVAEFWFTWSFKVKQ